MTEIVVNLTRHTATGRVPAAGVLRWTPTRRVHIDAPTDGAVDEVVVPAPFTVHVDGPTTIAVDPSGTSWAWTVHEATHGGRTIRTVAVPDSPTPVDYGDLVDIDPATLTPAAEPTAAWWAAHDALAAQVAGLGGGTGGGYATVQVGTLTLPASPAVGESVTVLADSSAVFPAGITWDSGGAPTVTDRLLISLVWSGDDWVGTYGPSIPAYVAPPIEVTAAGPTWTDDTDNGGGSWTTPTETGITYSPASGTATPEQEITVTAAAQAGYTIVGAASWSHTFPAAPVIPDSTAPTWSATFTMGTPTSTSVVATASALATDNVSVAGYEISYDGGTTWAAITPSGMNFTLAGSAGVAYSTTKLRARDAAGNLSTPLSVPSYTMAASTDTTAPTAGTLASSAITSEGFTLTVTGASDETALHAQPYAFTTNGGTDWSAYQASAVFVASGLTASTGYSCNWRVRDAAGNVSTGTAVTVTTGAAGAILASDTFNRANGALGNSDGPGALPWSPGPNTFSLISNQAYAQGASSRAAINVGQADHKVKVTVANALSGGVMLRGNADSTSYWRAIWFTDGSWYLTCYTGSTVHRATWVQAAPAIGDTITAQAVTNGATVDFKVWHNDTLVQEYTETNAVYTAVAGTHAGIFGGSAGVLFDDFEVVVP